METLQSEQCEREVPEKDSAISDLFGLQWHTNADMLSPKKKFLDPCANTKRQILRTIAENFDPLNFEGPLLNRARLFMHELQCMKELDWDTDLNADRMRLWRNICLQLNSAEPIRIQRNVGRRDDPFDLICFSDASSLIYGCVVYLHNLKDNTVSFIAAKK